MLIVKKLKIKMSIFVIRMLISKALKIQQQAYSS